MHSTPVVAGLQSHLQTDDGRHCVITSSTSKLLHRSRIECSLVDHYHHHHCDATAEASEIVWYCTNRIEPRRAVFVEERDRVRWVVDCERTTYTLECINNTKPFEYNRS